MGLVQNHNVRAGGGTPPLRGMVRGRAACGPVTAHRCHGFATVYGLRKPVGVGVLDDPLPRFARPVDHTLVGRIDPDAPRFRDRVR